MSVENHMVLRPTGRIINSRPTRRLHEDWYFELEMNGLGYGCCDRRNRLTLFIPKYFETDFASIPRPLWWLYPPDGPWIEASVVHDYLYCRNVNCTRFLADAIFRELMIHFEVPQRKILPIHKAVRYFGWSAFNCRHTCDPPIRVQRQRKS